VFITWIIQINELPFVTLIGGYKRMVGQVMNMWCRHCLHIQLDVYIHVKDAI